MHRAAQSEPEDDNAPPLTDEGAEASDRGVWFRRSPERGRSMPIDRDGRTVDETRFVAWLESPSWPDMVAASGSEATVEPLPDLLRRVSTSLTILPPTAATLLGLPAPTTLGEAADALLLAVENPAGPRCRSYRAAVYYLHDLFDPSSNGDPDPETAADVRPAPSAADV